MRACDARVLPRYYSPAFMIRLPFLGSRVQFLHIKVPTLMYDPIRLPHELTEAKRESHYLVLSHSRRILNRRFQHVTLL